MTPEEVVHRFFDRVHSGDVSVCDLYTEDGIRVDHEGRQFCGREAIADVYRAMFPLPDSHPEVAALHTNPPFVAAIMQWPEGSGRVGQYIDLFEISGDLIQALRVLV